MQEEKYIDLGQIWSLIKAKLWLIAIITVLSVCASLAASFFLITPIYQATTSILIGKDYSSATSPTSEYTYNEILMYQTSANTYAEIARSRTVAEKAADKLSIDITASQLMSARTVSITDNTQIMHISVTNSDPGNAMLMANTISECFITEAARLFPTGKVQIMDRAQLPSSPVSPVPIKNVVLAFAIGLAISLGIIFLKAYLDDTIKDEKELAAITMLPVLGTIPFIPGMQDEWDYDNKRSIKQIFRSKKHIKTTPL